MHITHIICIRTHITYIIYIYIYIIYLYIYIYIHLHTCMHAYTHAYIHTCIHTHQHSKTPFIPTDFVRRFSSQRSRTLWALTQGQILFMRGKHPKYKRSPSYILTQSILAWKLLVWESAVFPALFVGQRSILARRAKQPAPRRAASRQIARKGFLSYWKMGLRSAVCGQQSIDWRPWSRVYPDFHPTRCTVL